MTLPQYFRDDPYMTPKDIMSIIGRDKKANKDGLGRSTVYYKINNEMKHYKIGRRLFVKQSDFDKWMEGQCWDPSTSSR